MDAVKAKAASQSTHERPQRADAARNHEHLLKSAAATFVREGPRVTMQTLARDAGVGVGTLYRHFPNREALLATLQTRAYATVLELARAARASVDSDPLSAVRTFLLSVIAHRNEIVLPFTGAAVDPSATNAASTRAIAEELEQILESGKRSGLIRPDVGPLDLMLAGAYLARPLLNLPDEAAAARRHATLFVSGLHPGGEALGEGVATLVDVERAWYGRRD